MTSSEALPEIGPAPSYFTPAEVAAWEALAPKCDRRHPCTIFMLEAAVTALHAARLLRVAPVDVRQPESAGLMADAYAMLGDLGVDRDGRAAAPRWASGARVFGD